MHRITLSTNRHTSTQSCYTCNRQWKKQFTDHGRRDQWYLDCELKVEMFMPFMDGLG